MATTTLPKIINKGKSNGNVTKVPRTEPLVKLKAFPKLNTFIKIQVVINKTGKIWNPKLF